jgi:hypothetical protein
MNETMSESQLLWLVADKAQQCAAHDNGLALLLRALAAVSGGNGKDHVDKIVKVAESAEGAAASLRGFITSTRMRAVALEAQARQQQAKINATAERIANVETTHRKAADRSPAPAPAPAARPALMPAVDPQPRRQPDVS